MLCAVRPIALASSVSKVLERVILSKYEMYFCSNPLQFAFKPGYSTTLYKSIVKNFVSRYIHNGSAVLGCFLDASKAFDMLDHGVLFRMLRDRGLPLGSCCLGMLHNKCRCVGDLVFLMFTVYLDGLLAELSGSSVGCYWGSLFAGSFCYICR